MKNNSVMPGIWGSIKGLILAITLSFLFIISCARKAPFENAMLFITQEDYEQAYQEFNRVGSEAGDPNLQAEAMYYAAFYLNKLSKHNEALGRYASLNRQFPNSEWVDEALLQIGLIYNQLQNYESSQRAFVKLLDDFPDSELKDNAQRNIAMLFINESKYEKAYQEFQKLSTPEFKDYPDYQAEAMYYAAFCLNQLDRSNEALDYYNNLITQFSESEWVDDALLDIGKLSLYQGNFEEAISAYELLLTKDHDRGSAVAAKHGIARSHFGLKAWIKAINAYKRVINEHEGVKDITPNCSYQMAEAYYRLATEQRENGNTQKASKNFEAALSQYQKTLTDFPTDAIVPYARYGIMSVLNDLRRKEQLERLVLEYGISSSMPISGAPSDINLTGLSYFKLALTQEEHLKAYNEALENYQKAIPLVQTPLIRAQSYYRRGLIYQDKLDPPDKDKALEVFQTLISEYESSANTGIVSLVTDAHNRCAELNGQPLKLTPEHIAQIASGSTVLVETNRKSGSGFFVGPGQIATNYHVIEGAERATARLVGADRTYTIVGYIAVDVKRDLAILKVRDPSVKPLSRGDSTDVNQGASVYPIGNPLGLVNIFTDGQISSIQWVKSTRELFKSSRLSDIPTDDTPQKLFVMNADIAGGSSGGPVLNSDGEVIGVAVGESTVEQSINFAIPVNYLNELLKKVGPPKPLQQAGLAK